jgi:hypothetical protein
LVSLFSHAPVFQTFVFKPELIRWEASETDGRAERPNERERLSHKIVEVEFVVRQLSRFVD